MVFNRLFSTCIVLLSVTSVHAADIYSDNQELPISAAEETVDRLGTTRLMEMVYHNDLEATAQLLNSSKKALLIPNSEGVLPIHIAANDHNQPMTALLLGYGNRNKQLFCKTSNGDSALTIAQRKYNNASIPGRKYDLFREPITQTMDCPKYVSWLQEKYNTLVAKTSAPIQSNSHHIGLSDSIDEHLDQELHSAHADTVSPSSTQVEVHFSHEVPYHTRLSDRVIELVDKETQGIYGAMHIFTHPRIAGAIIARKQDNPALPVDIVIDRKFKDYTCGSLQHLIDAGCHIRAYKYHDKSTVSSMLMHNKFMIFPGGKTVASGSMNYSSNGDDHNQENVLMIKNSKNTLKKYMDKFEKLKQSSQLLKSAHLLSPSESAAQQPAKKARISDK